MKTRLAPLIAVSICMAGCVERTLTINSSPPAALVYLNDQEIGRTPVTRDFTWYGNYDLALRKAGYETLKTTQNVKAPLFQIVPFDLVAELLPFHYKDKQSFSYNLTPERPLIPDELLSRSAELKRLLQSGRHASTQPSSPAK